MAALRYESTESMIGSKDKSVGWYDKAFSGVNPEAKELLVNYANIEPDHVDQYAMQMVPFLMPFTVFSL